MHLLQSCDLLWGLLHGPSHMDQSLAGRARLIVTDELVADQSNYKLIKLLFDFSSLH